MIFLWKQPANSFFFFLFLCAMGSLRSPAEGERLQGLLGRDLTEEQWWHDGTNTAPCRMDISGYILQERLHSSSSSLLAFCSRFHMTEEMLTWLLFLFQKPVPALVLQNRKFWSCEAVPGGIVSFVPCLWICDQVLCFQLTHVYLQTVTTASHK